MRIADLGRLCEINIKIGVHPISKHSFIAGIVGIIFLHQNFEKLQNDARLVNKYFDISLHE